MTQIERRWTRSGRRTSCGFIVVTNWTWTKRAPLSSFIFTGLSRTERRMLFGAGIRRRFWGRF